MSHDNFAEEDLLEVGERVIEMADRLKGMNLACPGATAKWAFEMDGVRYVLRMTVDADTAL